MSQPLSKVFVFTMRCATTEVHCTVLIFLPALYVADLLEGKTFLLGSRGNDADRLNNRCLVDCAWTSFFLMHPSKHSLISNENL